jgi:hypothetical protein
MYNVRRQLPKRFTMPWRCMRICKAVNTCDCASVTTVSRPMSAQHEICVLAKGSFSFCSPSPWIIPRVRECALPGIQCRCVARTKEITGASHGRLYAMLLVLYHRRPTVLRPALSLKKSGGEAHVWRLQRSRLV